MPIFACHVGDDSITNLYFVAQSVEIHFKREDYVTN